MSLISVQNLTFGYEGAINNVFENVSFNIDTDWRLGLIGRNGKGKTTFFKLLMNKLDFRGSINKSVNFEYFPYEIKSKDRMTIDVINELLPDIDNWKIVKELNLLSEDSEVLYRAFNTLSYGQQVKVQLVILFLKENNFMLIDEPTNHLDNETRECLAEYLKKKHSFILVSHDRYFLDKVVDHIIAINNQSIEIVKGNYSVWKENKDRKDNFEISKNEIIKKDIARLELSAKSANKWSNEVEKTKYKTNNDAPQIDRGYIGHKSAKMMKKSKVIEKRVEKQIEEKKALMKDIDFNEELKIVPLKNDNRSIVAVKDLQIKYGSKELFKKLTFEVKNEDRVAIIGNNGAGKSSILKLIMGENLEFDGKINVQNGLKISYVKQTADGVIGTINEYAKKYNIDLSIFKAMLSKMGFSKEDFDTNIEDMSEGQKKKVLIAGSISENANLYIWDEPLNYIDILTRIQIENVILKYNPTIIFVEHDDYFINRIATKIINVEKVK